MNANIQGLMAVGSLAGLGPAASPSRTDTLWLTQNITNDGNADLSSQLFVEVTDLGGGVARFLVNNATGEVTSSRRHLRSSLET